MTVGRMLPAAPARAPVRPPAVPLTPLMLVALVTGPPFSGVPPVRMPVSPDSAATGLLVSWVPALVAGTVGAAMLTTWRSRLDPLPSPAGLPLAGGAVAEVSLATWLTALAAAGTTAAMLEGPDAFGGPACAATGWAGAAALSLPRLPVALPIVLLTAATAPALAAVSWLGPLLRVLASGPLLLDGVLGAALLASGALLLGGSLAAAPVLWPPPWPGMMCWVASWPAVTAALVAAGTGVSFVPLLDPAGDAAATLAAATVAAGTFAAGAA